MVSGVALVVMCWCGDCVVHQCQCITAHHTIPPGHYSITSAYSTTPARDSLVPRLTHTTPSPVATVPHQHSLVPRLTHHFITSAYSTTPAQPRPQAHTPLHHQCLQYHTSTASPPGSHRNHSITSHHVMCGGVCVVDTGGREIPPR